MHQGTEDVIVSGGCLLFTVGDCTDRVKADAVNSLLYTQLAASKKYSRIAEPARWKQTLLTALGRFGWILNTHETINQSASDYTHGTVWNWLRSELPVFMPTAIVAHAEAAAFARYRANPEQRAIQLFASQVQQHPPEPLPTQDEVEQLELNKSDHGTPVLLLIGVLGPQSSLDLLAVTFISRQPLAADFLFHPLSVSDIVGNIETTFCSLQMQELIHAQFRETFETALKDRRAEYVQPMQGVARVH
jgi:hypothetical protein